MYQTYYFHLSAPRPFDGPLKTANVLNTLHSVTEWARMYARSTGASVAVAEAREAAPFLSVDVDGAATTLRELAFPAPAAPKWEPDRSCPDCGCRSCWCD